MQVKDSNSRDPSAMELPNARGGIFSFPQTAPPPTASHCWTGSGHVNVEGTKQRHPALLALHGSWLRALLHPHGLGPQMLSGCQYIRTHSQRCQRQHTFPLQLLLLRVWMGVMAKREEIIHQRHSDLDLWCGNYLGMRCLLSGLYVYSIL